MKAAQQIEGFLMRPFKKTSKAANSTTSNHTTRRAEGLDSNGRLKPGYRYGKGGRIVKSKKQ